MTEINDREYENLVREGMTAARGGRRKLARRLLERAAAQNPTDPRVWLWLSATTDDAHEQRNYLEKAVASDPANAAAKKGLAILAEKLGEPVADLPQESLKDGYVAPDEEVFDPEKTFEAGTLTFECPSCGGRMRHDVEMHALVCESCGEALGTNQDRIADEAETPLDPALHTGLAHVWAASSHEIVCEQCGAHTFETPGVKTQTCPYCGSHQFVDSKQLQALVAPQVIGLFEIQEAEADKKLREWLNEGFFSPDDLSNDAGNFQLRPAYYPFWTFDGGVEIRWSAEVRENYSRSTSRNPEWRAVNGAEIEFFDDVLVPGVSAMALKDVLPIFPFKLKELVRFEQEHLAGWPAMAYDLPMSEASLLARETVIRNLRPKIHSRIMPGKEKRSVSIGAGQWTGLTYKHVLLPLWVGTFNYGSQSYRVFVNGQSGKVGGEKPRDAVKFYGIWAIGILLFVILGVIAAWLFLNLL